MGSCRVPKISNFSSFLDIFRGGEYFSQKFLQLSVRLYDIFLNCLCLISYTVLQNFLTCPQDCVLLPINGLCPSHLPGVGGSKINSNDCSQAIVLLFLLVVSDGRHRNEEYEGEEDEQHPRHHQFFSLWSEIFIYDHLKICQASMMNFNT